MVRSKLPERIKNEKCKKCKSNVMIEVDEQKYDWEIHCAFCGEIWWIDKEPKGNTGEDLKYQSSPYIRRKGKNRS
jgi:RNase P subunit RPR2